MKLKTLKDISLQINHEEVCPTDDLKSEAIEWMKYIKRNFGNVNPFKAQDFIIDFFNLTEADFK